MRRAAALLCLAWVLAGCSSTPSVTGTCDADALQAEIASLVDDHHLSDDVESFHIASVEAMTCSDDWAYVEATLEQDGQSTVTDHFLLRRDADIWVLKAPESACVDDPIPEPVRGAACSGSA